MSGQNGAGAAGNAGQPYQFGQFGQALQGQAGFIGRNTTGPFIGSRLAGQGGGQAFQIQGFNRGDSGSGFRNGQFGSGGAAPKLSIRPTQRVAFDFQPTSGAVATQRISARLDKVAARQPGLAGVTVSADADGKAVLRGEVADDDARRLAAALVRLEPGVREVVNELTVAAKTP